jgi:SAM-dependent methyltransferase
MMFGTQDAFEYDECALCRSLQISIIPAPDELAKHYPDGYYAHPSSAAARLTVRQRIRSWVDFERERTSLGLFSPFGFLSSLVREKPFVMPAAAGFHRGMRILDVGCGSGGFLDRLARMGFGNLEGVDPFIPATMKSERGVTIHKATLSEISGQWDCIMFHHSLEHVPDPLSELQAAAERLRDDGICIIRVPTPSSEAWEAYETDWVQLDAPRHLTLFSRDGMAALARATGFAVVATRDDCLPWSYGASELYRRKIPLTKQGEWRSHFSSTELSRFAQKAVAANRAKRGDQTGFILRRQ